MADILDGFDELTDEIQAEQTQRLAAAGVIARERDPDQYARANALADKRGLPVDVVADHLADFEAQDEDEEVAALASETPGLGEFLSDPRRRALAKGDVPALSRLAKAMQSVGGPVGLSVLGANTLAGTVLPTIRGVERANLAQGFQQATVGQAASLFHTVTDTVDQTIQQWPRRLFGTIADLAEREGNPEAAAALRSAFADPLGVAGMAEGAAGVQREVAADQQAQAEAIGGRPNLDQGLDKAIEQFYAYYGNMAVQSLPPMLLALATRRPMVGGSIMGATTGAQSYVDLRGEGLSRLEAAPYALGAAGTETALGSIGLRAATAPGLRSFITGPAIEAGTEALTELAQVNMEDAALGRRTPIEAQLLQMLDAAILGAGFGAIERGGSVGFDALSGNWSRQADAAVEDGRRLIRSVDGSARLEAITEAATAARLTERSPADAEALASMFGADAVVYLDAQVAQVLFQDDAALLESLVGGADAAAEMAALGDYKIPMAKWVSTVARLPNAAEMVRNGRLEADGLSAAALENLEAEAAQFGDTDAAAERVATGQPDTRQQVIDDVTGQLVSTGRYTPERAEAQARLWGAAFAQFGRLSGQDPFALYQRHMAGIGTEPTVLQTRRWNGTARLDGLIESIRTGRDPEDREILGGSLSSFVVGLGGVRDDTGELRGWTNRPGLLSASGVELDRAREAAVEAGYLPEGADVNDMLDAMDRDLRGDTVTSEANVDPARRQFALEREELLRAIDDTPALRDLSDEEFRALSNQQIADALFGSQAGGWSNFDQPAMNQSATFNESAYRPEVVAFARERFGDAIAPNGNPAWQNFVAWFGDSQAVDADGRPMVVYHGTVRDFDTFDSSAPSRHIPLPGFYFTPDRSRSEVFASAFHREGDLAPRIIDAYLSLNNPVEIDASSESHGGRMPSEKVIRAALDDAIAAGHDSAIIRGWADGSGEVQYVAFRPEQIKSATANQGNFDPEQGSILNQSAVDEGTGLPLNDDGTVTLYHHTSAAAADAIRRTGVLRSAAEPDVYMTTTPETNTGYGDTAVALRVDPARLQIDDEFPDGRRDFRLDTGRPGGQVRVTVEQGQTGTAEQTLFQRAADAVLGMFQRQPKAKGPRGQIQVFPDRRMAITLFENADASTFIHESGHFFLEVFRDLAAQPDADPKLVADFNALLEWMGVESGAEIEVKHHEQFARGFEAYLGEGRAPSPELQSVFAQFKAWILGVYRSLTALNVTLTDDVRGVFDRMLATEEEIEAAQVRQGMEPMFTSAAEAQAVGLTEKRLADYRAMMAEATEEARAEVMAKLMKAHQRERARWWKEERAKVRAEVSAAYEETPAVRALRILSGRKSIDGVDLAPPLLGMKLDRAAVVAGWGDAYLKRIGRTYAKTGGLHPDEAAAVLGFASGDQLLNAIANAPDTLARVDAETDAIMRERHGDPMTDGTMAEVAMDGAHNAKRVKAMQFELDLLAQLAGQPTTPARVIRAIAADRISKKSARALRPNDFLAAERRAAREATRAAGRQDYAAALNAKRQQALNAAMFTEARKAQTEFEKHRRYLRRVEGRRDKIGKAGADYLEQIDALLEALELRQVSGRAVERRQRLADWVKAQEAAGNAVNIPQKLLDETALTNVADLSMADLRDVIDTIKQIEHLANLKNKLILAGETRDRIEVDEAMAASVIASHEARPERTGDVRWYENVRKRVMDLDVQRLLPTNIARELDGYQEGGAVWTHIIKPIRDAIYSRVNPAQEAMQVAVANIYAKHYSKAEMGRLDSIVYRPEIGDDWSKGRILSLAMHWGSQGNREAILSQAHSRITEAQAVALLRTLDARDWAFVQDMVDQVNSYWPEIAEAQRRRTGLVPQKVDGQPFTIETADGQMIHVRGGYFPLKYDSERSSYGTTLQEIDDVYNDLRVGKTAKAATRNGHTIERVGSGGKTVALGLDIAQSHMRDVIRDIHLGDAITYVYNTLHGFQFTEAVIAAGKRDYLTALDLWLKDVAAGEMGAKDTLGAVVKFARQNTTAAVLAWKVTTAGLQMTGLVQTASVIGRRNMLKGLARLMGKSWVGPHSIWEDIKSRSDYMRERFGKIPDAVQVVSDARDGTLKAGHAAMLRYGYVPMARMQMIADAATWLAGERLGLKMFDGDVQKARDYADDLVIRAQSPENFIDKPGIARGTLDKNHRQSELVKSTTMLLSYMMAKGNVAREKYQGTDFTKPMQVAKFTADMVQLFWVEQAIMALVTNGLPDDEDDDGYLDDWLAWISGEAVLGSLATIPMLSQLATEGRGYTAQGILERTWGAVDNAGDRLVDDEFNRKDVKALVNLAGVATGIPSSQINTTSDALWRTYDGEDVPAIEYLIRPEKPRD